MSNRWSLSDARRHVAAHASTQPDRWWSVTSEEVVSALAADLDSGLTESEVTDRRRQFGSNKLELRPPVSRLAVLLRQFRSVVVVLLGAAIVVALAFNEVLEAIAIGIVIVLNAAIGFVTELRAERSMEALQRLGSHTARVKRNGYTTVVAAEDLVPGDVIRIEAGEIVPADARVVASSQLESDESVITGESLPVSKGPESAPPSALIHERSSMLYKGTSISRGGGTCVVTSIGQSTELGKIADLARFAEPVATPLEKRLDSLGRRLVGLTLVVGVAVVVAGVLRDKDFYLMVQTAVALAVATIPEGLPIVATIALAAGVRRMARRNVLINRLASVETLGSTHVICTDKTGTLTENRMTVVEIITSEGRFGAGDLDLRTPGTAGAPSVSHLVGVVAALCNNATPEEQEKIAEPLEAALVGWVERSGMSVAQIRSRYPRVTEQAFDPEVKMMATVHGGEGGGMVAVKGAPEAVLEASDSIRRGLESSILSADDRRAWSDRAEEMGASGRRVLGVAWRSGGAIGTSPYSRLEFLGLIGMHDPPRREVRKALAQCRLAGMRVVMVTGDQPGTAASVARAVGLEGDGDPVIVLGQQLQERDARAATSARGRALLQASIFARVSPSQKLDLIRLYQDAGHIVAMTGDGVNDAPALRKADIAVAMGVRGTEVAREAADVVLLDDSFSSIVSAVREGRIIFDNIRTFVVYLMSCNLSEVLVVGVATVIGGPLPILPLQILFLNLVTDVFPALALGVSPGRTSILREPPRPRDAPILRRTEWKLLGGLGIVLTIGVLGSLYVAAEVLHQPPEKAGTVSFLTLVFSQLVNVFNMRGRHSNLVSNEVTRNRYVWIALSLCTLITFAVLLVPSLAEALALSIPDPAGWAIVIIGSGFTLLFGQLLVTALGRLSNHRESVENR